MSETPKRGRGASVFIYLAILFAAAFVMLLMAYFMQQRNNEAAISGLQNSQFESLDGLRQENEALQKENEALRTQVEALETALSEAEQKLEAAEADAQEDFWPMAYFWFLDSAFRDGHYEECAQLLQSSFSDSGYPVPDFSAASAGLEYDASARFQEISGQLVEMGYLDADWAGQENGSGTEAG